MDNKMTNELFKFKIGDLVHPGKFSKSDYIGIVTDAYGNKLYCVSWLNKLYGACDKTWMDRKDISPAKKRK